MVIYIISGTFLKHTSMSNLRDFKEFIYFYKELAYIFIMCYLLLIVVIIVLSIKILQQRDENETLKGIINRTPSYTVKHYPKRILKAEYHMLSVRIEHR